MGIVPTKVQDLLDFAEAHGQVWTGVFAQIGLSSAQATAFKAAATLARGNYNDAVSANLAKKAAYNLSQTTVTSLRQAASEALALIKAHADNAADPSAVYQAAQIPAPLPPAPAPAPGTPTDFTVALQQTGAVTLKWKCANPVGVSGTIYEVRRRTGSGSFMFVGAIGVREFTDDTLPAGSVNVTYQITAVRSTLRGLPAQFNVNFGIGGDGFATVTSVQPMKIAA